jgi:hypothetical protein
MGDGTKENPYTREDVLRLIEENGGRAKGLDLSEKIFEPGIDLSKLDLKEANLSGAHLEGADLEFADLEGAELRNAHLEGADLHIARLKEADLRGAHLEGASLIDANLKEADLEFAKLDNTDLRFAHLEGADLLGVEYPRDTKLDDIYWGDYVLYRESSGEFGSVISTYRSLKTWYTEHGMNDIAAKFYYREMEARRKETEWSWNPKRGRHRLALEILRALFGYGEDWKRVLYWMALVVVGSAVAYYISGELDLLYSLYFSVVSFTALGYGKWVNITPEGWVQALGAFQSLTGVFLMALLLVTFFRKWTR